MPVEIGRWQNIELEDRKCTVCNKNTLGDELHYLMECLFKEIGSDCFLGNITKGPIVFELQKITYLLR